MKYDMLRILLTALVLCDLYTEVVISEKPKCSEKISDITALIGTTAFLPCQVEGKPKPVYEWLRSQNHTLVPLGMRFTESDRGLIIRDVTEKDSGKYQVKLKNDFNHFHSTVHLHVKDPATIKPSRFKNAEENSNFKLSCGKKPPQSTNKIEWLDSMGNDVNHFQRFNVYNDGSLHINQIRRFDSGGYTCINRSGDGMTKLTYDVYLNIQYLPTIIIHEDVVEVYQNSTATMPCTAIGNPEVKVKWQFPNKTLIEDDEKFDVFDNGTLQIHNVQGSDVFSYACLATNSLDQIKYGFTRLLMIVPPFFLTYPDVNIIVKKGDSLLLDCMCGGIPKPNISWQHFNSSEENARWNTNSSGVLYITDVQVSDTGTFICYVKWRNDRLNRQFDVTVISEPEVPKKLSTNMQDNLMRFTWIPSYNGGSSQVFELWSRGKNKTDYEWDVIVTNDTSYKLDSRYSAANAELYVSIRASNELGYSNFSYIIKASSSPGASKWSGIVNSLSDSPLAPYNFSVNISTDSYALDWKYLVTPGRPAAEYFVIEYRENSDDEWKEYPQRKRSRRSATAANLEDNHVSIGKDEITGVNHPVEFQVYSVGNNKKSTAVSPMASGMNAGNTSPPKSSRNKLIPPIILGVIFAFFLFVLLLSLYCFCRRRKRRSKGGRNVSIVHKTDSETNLDGNSLEFDDNAKLFAPTYIMDSPRRYHVSACPALELGQCNKKYSIISSSLNQEFDDVYYLLKPHPGEKNVCTCTRKYIPLNNKQLEGPKKIYDTSSPSVILTSDPEASSVVPSEIFDDEDYEISDVEEGSVGELDKAHPSVPKGLQYRDSYDRFCRSDFSESAFKDVARMRLSSTEKTEVDKNMERIDLRDLDNSSENSATESERRLLPKEKRDLNYISKLFERKSSAFADVNSSTSDPDSVTFENAERRKSNKFERFPTSIPSNFKRDTSGYFSDNPSRASPLFVATQRFIPQQKPKLSTRSKKEQYFSEDEGIPHSVPYRSTDPPSYDQAMITIGRKTDRNEIADSEQMYDQLLEMEKLLGVHLNDSYEADLNASTLPASFRQAIPKTSSDTGYMSDVQIGERYTNREKTERCAQLLNEFKSSKSSEFPVFDENSSPIHFPDSRPSSAIGPMETEPHNSRRILKRSNSTGSNYVHKEWLV